MIIFATKWWATGGKKVRVLLHQPVNCCTTLPRLGAVTRAIMLTSRYFSICCLERNSQICWDVIGCKVWHTSPCTETFSQKLGRTIFLYTPNNHGFGHCSFDYFKKKTKEMEVLNIAHLLTVNPKNNDRPSGSYSPLCFRGCQNPVAVGSIFYTFLVKGILINFTMNQCFRRTQQDGPCLSTY